MKSIVRNIFEKICTFQNAACVLVPGGFGDRGVTGMILAAKYARENNVPYLGICLGMQISVIEFARSVSDIFFHYYTFCHSTIIEAPL